MGAARCSYVHVVDRAGAFDCQLLLTSWISDDLMVYHPSLALFDLFRESRWEEWKVVQIHIDDMLQD